MGDKMTYKDFLSSLKLGDFSSARSFIYFSNEEDEYNFYSVASFDVETSMSLYTLMCFLLLEDERAQLHNFISLILDTGLVDLEDAYSSAICHVRRAAELDIASLSYKRFILQYYTVPGCLLNKSDIKKIATDMLKLDAKNWDALQVLRNLDNYVDEQPVSTSLKDQFMFYIIQGKYEDAKNVVKGMSFDKFVLFFRLLCAEYKTLALYTFIIFKLLDNETHKWHKLACEVLRNELSSLSGAESSALFHEYRIGELGN